MIDQNSVPEGSSPPEVRAPAAAELPDAGTKRTDWVAELRSIFWLVLAVLAFHSFIAKPFYIPSESMMPTLIKGDRLVVSKYPYGWSFASLTFHPLGFMPGRLFGRMPERGDVVIVVPPGEKSDYIKRVIGLPGDRLGVRGGIVFLNGKPLPRARRPDALIPIDANVPCDGKGELMSAQFTASDGKRYCRLPIYRETLPNGRTYDTVDFGDTVLPGGGYSPGDNYDEITIPAGRVFLMGDNRDESADSRFASGEPNNGLGGPVPYENLGGRAELITFSLDGSTQWLNPISWFTAFRSGRAGVSLRPDTTRP